MRHDRAAGFGVVNWKKILFGTCVGILVMVIVMAGSAWLIINEMVDRSGMEVTALMALLSGSFVGGLSSGRGEGGGVRCMLVALDLILVLLVLNLVLCDGNLAGFLPGCLALFGGAGAAILLGGEKKPRGRRKIRTAKFHNR